MTCATTAFVISFCLTVAMCDIDHITIYPDEEIHQCPSEPCLTLLHFANNFSSESYSGLNLTLEFLPGNYTLSTELLFVNLTMVTMLANNDTSSASSQPNIYCNGNARTKFNHVQSVEITRLKFIGCTGIRVENVNQFFVRDSSFFAVEEKIGTALTITQISASILNSFFINHTSDTFVTTECNKWYYPTRTHTLNVTVGGAIILEESEVIINQSHFRGNRGEVGGAIFSNLNSNITIVNCHFIANNQTLRIAPNTYSPYCSPGGGAIYAEDAVAVSLSDSHFEDSFSEYGGAIILVERSRTLTITNCSFNNSSASQLGGAILVERSGTLTITNCSFNNNSARSFGGAARIYDVDNVTIAVSNFTNNKASHGGAVYVHKANMVNISTSNFINNQVRYHGGAVRVWEDVANLTICTSTFTNNKAGQNGAAVAVYQFGHLLLGYITMTDNKFKDNAAKYGGAVYVRGEILRLTVIENKFTSNKATVSGGVLLIYVAHNFSSVIISKSNFTSNTANENGGVLSLINTFRERNNLTITDCQSEFNRAGVSGGILNLGYVTVFNMSNSCINPNSARDGGALHYTQTTVYLEDNQFFNNSATTHGGVIYSVQSSTMISKGAFLNNHADNNGGTFYIDRGSTSVLTSTFSDNSAGNDGAVMRSRLNNLTIFGCNFTNNNAKFEGGVLWTDQVELNVSKTAFSNNTAHFGGAIYSEQRHSLLSYTSFMYNKAIAGGVLWAKNANFTSNSVTITNIQANFSVLYLLTSTTVWSSVNFSENIGSMLTVESDVVIKGTSRMENNLQSPHWMIDHRLQRGGAITATYKSRIQFEGKYELKNNSAKYGGALNIIQSKVNIEGNVTILNNKGTLSGGGINLDHSDLTCSRNSTLILYGNEGIEKGSGVMATSSTIIINGSHNVVNISHNRAKNGGGLYFQLNSNFQIFKYEPSKTELKIVTFTSNQASDHGGAVYVSDDGICTSLSDTDCTFQALALYSLTQNDNSSDTESHNIFFYNNTAGVSGNSLFGGLLDRCTVSTFAESNINKVDMDYSALNGSMITDGAEYLQSISNIQNSDVSSEPVRVCFCRDGLPDCSFQLDPIEIDKGQQKNVSISVSVVDQLDQLLLQLTVHSHFASGNFLCQNHIKSIHGMCSKIDFAVDSLNDTEILILSLSEGPCEHIPQSKAYVTFLFVCSHCPIGFEPQNTQSGCKCSCDSKLFPYFTNCSGEILVRETNAWVTFLNNSGNSTDYQYLLHPYCPLDYCQPPTANVKINLNEPNGADSQCTNHRSGLLCSTCQTNFSLSLGSSHCIQCSTKWRIKLTTIIVSAIVGSLLLVIFLSSLNLTVAVGTLNGITFYANIVFANRSILLPSLTPKFITIFISWLNLEVGFDTCFFDGLDTYWKTLIQLVFPAYIIFLVVIAIILAKFSNKFAKLIGKRNPVATLTTLILLSYAKLHNVIASLSSTVLNYPDGNSEVVWLPDATVGYLKGKHIALFLIAVLILMLSIFYTTILLLWQWLLRLSDKKLFAWIKNQKLCHFIEPYHAPYTFKHRYWTGLLLLARVILYIIFATNFQGDPQLPLLAITFAVGFFINFQSSLEC